MDFTPSCQLAVYLFAAKSEDLAPWRVRDSNPRRLRRLIYSQIPLAAWVTRLVHSGTPKDYQTELSIQKLCERKLPTSPNLVF